MTIVVVDAAVATAAHLNVIVITIVVAVTVEIAVCNSSASSWPPACTASICIVIDVMVITKIIKIIISGVIAHTHIVASHVQQTMRAVLQTKPPKVV